LKGDHPRTIPSLTYILGFSVRFFQPVYSVLGILWDKIHIKIFYSEIWVEMIFEWPTFKIMCNTPILIKQKMTNKEISIFSNSSHFERRAGLSDTILKGDHPRTIPAKFALIWFRDFFSQFIPFRNIMR
jgi:hypothetical protein